MNRKEAFRRWLQTNKVKKNGKVLKENVIESYIKSLSHLSDEMYNLGVISKRLYSMRDYNEIKCAVKDIRRSAQYDTQNKAYGNMFNKSLDAYIEFANCVNQKAHDVSLYIELG